MKTSVIIPCFNCEKTIGNAINALISQLTTPLEIILVDDGSTDGTKGIIGKFKSKVTYLYQKNTGPAKARNAGARMAKGDIILFTDSDCVPQKNWVTEMTVPFQDKNVSGVQGSYKSNQKDLIARFGQIEIEDRYERMKHAKKIDWIGSYSAAFRRKEFLALGGYDETFPIASGEDPEFSFRLAKNGGKLIFNPAAIVYHTHPATLKKYLHTKCFRAFYRPKMYAKHKEKMVNDSYTPQVLKLQIPLSGIVLMFAILSPFIGVKPVILFMVIFIATTLPFVSFAIGKDVPAAIASPALIFLRSIVFIFGLVASKVKK